VVERFHQAIKDLLYSLITEEKNKFDIKGCLDIVLEKYNIHENSSKNKSQMKFYILIQKNYSKKF